MRLLALALLLAAPVGAQEPAPPPPGKVIFSTDHPPAPPVSETSSSAAPAPDQAPPDALPKVPVTDEERSAIAITAYDLDLHLIPADFSENVHATLTLRNTSADPLARIPLQISGTLRWQAISAAAPAGLQPLTFTQSPIATDADHTGYAQEAILTPPQPLAPGATLVLSVFYSGEIRQSADRLTLIGTPPDRAGHTDWDEIAPTSDAGATALRGFGNVLWYPVAAPAAVLGEGNQLFSLIERQRLLDASTSMRLHLTVEYLGDPPDLALFNGQPQPLAKTPDSDTDLVADTVGLATADFPPAPIGFRAPSLFLTAQRAVPTDGELLSIITGNLDAVAPYASAASTVAPLLSDWFGPTPLAPLLLLDHPGEPFADAALLVAQLSPSAQPKLVAPELVRGLTHAWFRVPAPTSIWLDQGLPEFMSLLWIERTQGREAALAQLQHAATLIALAEPDLTPATPSAAPTAPGPGQPLTQAFSDVYVRLKSASVLWQLRDILGEDPFRNALTVYRRSLSLNPALDRDPASFQKSLERTTRQDLAWFFDDWVYRDRGLPDLSIVQINPRLLPARPGKNSGYLVAVEVHNDGDAAAEVPITVRAGASLTSTQRLRILPHASASTRILFDGTPKTLDVNDGGVPELRTTTHTQHIQIEPPSQP